MKSRFSYSLWLIFFSFLLSVKAKDINVCPSCPFISVKEAVTAAQEGDRIIIRKGVYKEREILIDKSIRVIGHNFPVIDGENAGEIFIVRADSVLITGLQIQHVGISYVQDRAGIKLNKAKHCVVEGNKLLNTYFGIYLAHSDSCVIRNNEITGFGKKETETGNAIHLWYCRNILIEGNHASGHRDGIYLEFVESSKIMSNDCHRLVRYGMHFMFSHNNEYFHNKFSDNGAGVAVMYSRNIYMHENIFQDNWSPVSNGILLKDIKDSRIEKNIFKRNTIGMYAEGCLRLTIVHNDFEKNGWAVKILGNCEDNRFSGNNFIANTFEVVTNSSANRNFFENNYWSEYSGYDLNKDGVGDVPHSPVKLFTYVIEQIPEAIVLLRSLFIDLLNLAEKVTPVITPETLTDAKPLMKQIRW